MNNDDYVRVPIIIFIRVKYFISSNKLALC